MSAFLQSFAISPDTRILDVGGVSPVCTHHGTVPLWNGLQADVTTVNIQGPADVIADARELPFPDKSFEVVFSNSLIEHVGTELDQRQCASEIRRVGRSYYVQCPNRWFPLEVHWPVPLPYLHWLPRAWFNPSPDDGPLRLLSARELQSMFPEAKIQKERFLGFTKSIMAVYRP